MSKKKQNKKLANQKDLSSHPPESLPPDSNTHHAVSTSPEFELIRFDKKVNIFLFACAALFFLFVILKWHNSSIPWWNQVIDDGVDRNRGIIAGQPRGIRSDEWLVTSSFILSQHEKNFPVVNESLGYGKTPLVWKLPTNHITSKIRPSQWGYYFLDIERAFSWNWNFKIFPFLISCFLLLMLFTRNHFLLSLFGSFWVLLSSAIQWWSINTELLTYGCLSLISFIYILISTRPWTIIVNGILLLISFHSFVLLMYPAYQVPLSYFLLALLIGFIIKNKSILKESIPVKLAFKIMTLGLVLTCLMYLIYLFYVEAKDTIEVISRTVYPGERNESGGDFNFIRMFTDNFSMFMNEKNHPAVWLNICELSSFLMLSPIASLMIAIDFFRTKKTDALLFSVLIFHLIIFIWLFAGFPDFLSQLSLFKTSPANRTFFIFGFSNVIATLLYLAHHRTAFLKNNMNSKIISFIIVCILSYAIHYFLNKQSGFFFKDWQVWIATLVFACLNWLIIYFHSGKKYQIGFYLIVLAFIFPNIKINPLSVGLAPYFENKYFMALSDINRSDPNAGWVVFGSHIWGDFLKAAGINCFNGAQFAPPLKKLQVLDPSLENAHIYNRYAHITFMPSLEGSDEIKFSLVQTDHYAIQMDPCSPRLNQIGIKYFLFTRKPVAEEVRCMTRVHNPMGLIIYKRGD